MFGKLGGTAKKRTAWN